MKLKKYFAFLLVLCMLTTVLPYSSFAQDGQAPLPEEDLLPPDANGGLTELPEELPPADPVDPPAPVDPPVEPVDPPVEPVDPPVDPVDPPAEPSPEVSPAPVEPSPIVSPAPEASPTPEVSPSPEVSPAPVEPVEPDDGDDTPVFYNDAYSTLQEAIDAIGSGTITLTADPLFIPEVALIDENSDIELDLNGHQLLGADIQNCGTLTICDSGDDGEFIGSVVNRGHCESDGESHEAYAGVLNIESGKIVEATFVLEQDGDASLHAEDASVKVNVTGGKFMNVQFTHRYAYDDNGSLRYEDAAACGEVTVTGGSFAADPSALLSEDYAAVMNDEGMYAVIEKTWEDPLPEAETPAEEEDPEEDLSEVDEEPSTDDGEADPEASPDPDGETDPEASPDPDGETDPEASPDPDEETEPEDTPDEIVPEEPEEEKTLVDLDIFISQGEGTVVVDGEEYTEDASIQIVAEDEPVLEIIPEEDFTVGNVYLGMNGDSTAYSGVDQIELPVKKASRMTAMVFFAPTPKHTVTVNYTGNGTVSFNSVSVSSGYREELSAGSTANLEFVPDTDWFVQNVTVGSESKGSITTLSLDNISSDVVVTVTFKQVEDATVTYKNEESAMLDTDTGLKTGSVIKVHDKHTPLTRTGYNFLGWKCDQDGNLYAEGASYTLPGDVVFTAQWQPVKYTINYVVNGGTLNVSNPAEYDVSMAPYFLPTDSSVLFKPNAYFRGWYESSDFSGSAITRIEKDQVGDKTLYARWEYMINVTKSGNGTGTVKCDGVEVTSLKVMDYEEKILAITPDAGCIVKSITVNGAPVAVADTISVAPNGADANVEVVFEAAGKMTVNFNIGGKVRCDGVEVASGSVVSIPAGGSVAVEAVPDAYYFMNTAVLKPQTQPEIPYASAAFTVDNPGEDSVLTIEFKPQTDVTLTYDADNGTAPATVTAHAGIETALASAPTKTGYQFTGWACDADGVIYPAGAAYTPKSDATFTAQWTQEYTITFVSNGGTTIPPRKYTVLSPDITLPTPTKQNSTFLGWFTDSGFAESSQIFVVPQGSTGNITVYAKWETYYKVSVYYTNNGSAYYQNRQIPSGSSFEVKEGEKATVRFAATTSNYNVYNVTVNNGGNSRKLGSIDTCTVGPVHEDYIINCTFAPNFMHPITGDDSHLGLWAAVMAVSALAATAAVVFIGKRRKED